MQNLFVHNLDMTQFENRVKSDLTLEHDLFLKTRAARLRQQQSSGSGSGSGAAQNSLSGNHKVPNLTIDTQTLLENGMLFLFFFD